MKEHFELPMCRNCAIQMNLPRLTLPARGHYKEIEKTKSSLVLKSVGWVGPPPKYKHTHTHTHTQTHNLLQKCTLLSFCLLHKDKHTLSLRYTHKHAFINLSFSFSVFVTQRDRQTEACTHTHTHTHISRTAEKAADFNHR